MVSIARKATFPELKKRALAVVICSLIRPLKISTLSNVLALYVTTTDVAVTRLLKKIL
ncbi:hypothetical protein WDC_1271 [Paucilactobacillus wasatchensis]|uniref:Uncharacterized protein n=1 Tax=Paucilactobacillus wasatchensis TaxID=1335616 RepID=A0A0D1A8S2_9LACO|nr:hypothetical protein WDC_1271 [Paucilactobacillus wasatchensis]